MGFNVGDYVYIHSTSHTTDHLKVEPVQRTMFGCKGKVIHKSEEHKLYFVEDERTKHCFMWKESSLGYNYAKMRRLGLTVPT